MFVRPVIEVDEVWIELYIVLDNTKTLIERDSHTVKHGLKCVPIDIVI
jgi:hypothetical protein